MPSDAVVGPTFTGADAATLTAGKIYEITTLPTNAADLAAYKAVLLASGNTTLQLESEIVVGSTFEVTSDTDLVILSGEYGKAVTTDIDRTATLSASKTYIVSVAPDAAENDYDEDDELAEKFFDKTSAAYRGASDAGAFADSVGVMEVGDVLVVNSEITTAEL